MRMDEILSKFPEHCREALEIAEKAKMPDVKSPSIYIAGMGGSGIAGRLLQSYLSDEIDVPVSVISDYSLPKYANKNSLVFAVSASGNTEETLSVYNDAKNKGATIIGLTAGGKLEELCKKDNNSCLKFPSGLPPRCTLGYQFFILLRSLEVMKIIKEKTDDIEEAIIVAESMQDKGETRMLAEKIYNKIPIIFSSQWLEPVAYRWVTQLNENAKMLAFHNAIPEQNHNQINALSDADDNFFIIFIKDIDDNKKRFEFLKSIIKFPYSEVYTVGTSKLARMISAICLGDWCSYHAALLRKVDPMQVEIIERLKKYLENK